MNPQRLKEIMLADNLSAVSFEYGITYTYPLHGLVKVFEAYIPIKKVDSNLEPRKAKQRTYSTESKESVFEVSLARTKSKIRDYVLANSFDLFATFTFAKDRTDIEKSKRKMTHWLSNQQKRNGKFEYLLVSEFHKDGEAIHFHGLLMGYPGTLRPAINPHTGRKLTKRGHQIYSLPGFRSGFTNVRKIDESPESRGKVASYVTKYITKDMVRIFGKNRYWASHGLELPVKTYGLPAWYTQREPIWQTDTKYGRVSFFLNSPAEFGE